MKIDQTGIDLIAEFEGLENEAYPDPATGDEPWTIGIGHTSAAGYPDVFPGLWITDEEAHEIFARDVVQYEDVVNKNCLGPTTQNQFNAMVSLTYNIGGGNFDGSSVERYHNEQNYPEAAESFLLWNKANGEVMAGLTRRREAEKALYETPDTVVEPEPIDPDEITTPPDEAEHPPAPVWPIWELEYEVNDGDCMDRELTDEFNIMAESGFRFAGMVGKKIVWERRKRK
jgi:GH24 family phage-related lysozyme (muramidase)